MSKKIIVKIKKNIKPGHGMGRTPLYATPGAAGADLYACLDEEIVIRPGERVQIPTGIALELPGPEVVALIFARSGLAFNKGLSLCNGVGVVDSDYRGEVKVPLINLGSQDIKVENGERIAQILFVNVAKAVFVEVEKLEDTPRGEGGFGSTGHK